MTDSVPPDEYRVFPTRWRYILPIAVFCWMAGVATFFLVQDRNPDTAWYSVLIPPLLAAPFICHFAYLGLRNEPLLTANRDSLELRSALFPWRRVCIGWHDVISIRGIAEREGLFEELAVELCRPLDCHVPRLWRLRQGNTYYFFLGGADTPAPVVASNLRPFFDAVPRPRLSVSGPPQEFRTVWTFAYGLFNLIVAACLFALSVWWQRLPFAVAQFGGVRGFALLGAALCLIPFIYTYTKLGLNQGESEAPPEVRKRHAELRRASPIWTFGWYLAIGSIPGVFLLEAVMGMAVEPFICFCGSATFLTGMWFLFGYPAARKLIGS